MTPSVAQPGQDTPELPARPTARKLREARAKSWQSLIVPAFVVFVLGVNLLFGAVVLYGSIQRHFHTEDTAAIVHTALITRPLLDGTFCHYTVFDSTSSKMLVDKVARCDDSHGKHTSGFNWGGK
jgi:hypothetical protein